MQSPPAGVFISQVGHQPGAVAAAASALINVGLIGQILLLHSFDTKPHATRLARHFFRYHPRQEVSSVEIKGGDQVDLIVSSLEQNALGEAGTKTYLNISSGTSFFWAKMSRKLSRRQLEIYPVYADFNKLINLGDYQSWQIPNLGLEALLELHEIKASYQFQNSLATGFKVLNASDVIEVEPDFVYEERGRLFCLWEGVTELNQMRRIVAFKGDLSVLNGLQLHKTVVTELPFIFYRARFNGIEGILLDKLYTGDPVQDWRQRNTTPPGRVVPDKNYQDVSGRAKLNMTTGGGGTGEQLLVCLGNDATSTLVALFAHKPVKALIVYDSDVPIVNWLADNIFQCALQLPVGKLGFLPIPGCLSGSGIDSRHLSFFEEAPIWGNISPGSKGQSYAFGQLQKVKLCSIINSRSGNSRVESLEEGEVLSLECELVPPQVLGRIQGGPGVRCRIDDDELRQKSDFLQAMARAVAIFANKNGGFWPLRKADKTKHRQGYALTSEWQSDQFHVALTSKGSTFQGTLDAAFDPKSKKIRGDWLEDVVAGAFMGAGAQNLCVGMEWPWDVLRRKINRRTEIDVVFPWKTHHVVVSVKAKPLKEVSDEESKCDEIRAMALECFGRLSLPVLVCFKPKSANDDALSLRLLEKRKVLVLSLFQLADPQRLAALLNDSFSRLQTL